MALINSTGVASALAVGTSAITASLGSVTSPADTLTVRALVSITVTPGNPSVAKELRQQFIATGTFPDGSTQDLTSSVTWMSATPSVATVSKTGLAWTQEVGTSVITASLGGVTSSGVTLSVTDPLVSIAVLPSNRSVARGFTQQFTATGTYIDGSTRNLTYAVTWASATPAVATVSGTGLASSLAVGTSVITASLDGVTSPGATLSVMDTSLSSVFTVTTGTDSPRAGTGSGGSGDLRYCIAQANLSASSGTSLIQFAADVTTVTLTQGTLNITDTHLTIQGQPGMTTISGNQLFRIFQVDATSDVAFDHLRITATPGGNRWENGAIQPFTNATGGGIKNLGTVTISNCTISGNDGDSGGGIWNLGTMTVSSSTISGNNAFYDREDGDPRPVPEGGGIRNDGAMSVSNCTISENVALNTALKQLNSIADLLFPQFLLSYGSGIGNYGTMTVISSTISGGFAWSGSGGGIHNAGKMTVSNCTISGNRNFAGAGITNDGKMTVSNSTISGNFAELFGGGILNNGTMTLSNSTISGNTAVLGTGILNGGTMTVSNCTLYDNAVVLGQEGGGGIANLDTLKLNNTIVAHNAGGDLANDGSSPLTGSNNLIEDGSYLASFSSSIQGDPMLGVLGNYGGPTQTIPLLAGSPALRQGSFSLTGGTPDQRGFPRSNDVPVDIGAFQTQALLTVNTAADSTGVPGNLSLRDAVNLAMPFSSTTILFDPLVFATPQTITLGGTQLDLKAASGSVTIAGLAAGVTISGGDLSRVFRVEDGVTADLSNLTITGGFAEDGAGLFNAGNLTVSNVVFASNFALGLDGDYGGYVVAHDGTRVAVVYPGGDGGAGRGAPFTPPAGLCPSATRRSPTTRPWGGSAATATSGNRSPCSTAPAPTSAPPKAGPAASARGAHSTSPAGWPPSPTRRSRTTGPWGATAVRGARGSTAPSRGAPPAAAPAAPARAARSLALAPRSASPTPRSWGPPRGPAAAGWAGSTPRGPLAQGGPGRARHEPGRRAARQQRLRPRHQRHVRQRQRLLRRRRRRPGRRAVAEQHHPGPQRRRRHRQDWRHARRLEQPDRGRHRPHRRADRHPPRRPEIGPPGGQWWADPDHGTAPGQPRRGRRQQRRGLRLAHDRPARAAAVLQGHQHGGDRGRGHRRVRGLGPGRARRLLHRQ